VVVLVMFWGVQIHGWSAPSNLAQCMPPCPPTFQNNSCKFALNLLALSFSCRT
jgi:hypothetical protein